MCEVLNVFEIRRDKKNKKQRRSSRNNEKWMQWAWPKGRICLVVRRFAEESPGLGTRLL
jgi:hypothetical protein